MSRVTLYWTAYTPSLRGSKTALTVCIYMHMHESVRTRTSSRATRMVFNFGWCRRRWERNLVRSSVGVCAPLISPYIYIKLRNRDTVTDNDTETQRDRDRQRERETKRQRQRDRQWVETQHADRQTDRNTMDRNTTKYYINAQWQFPRPYGSKLRIPHSYCHFIST